MNVLGVIARARATDVDTVAAALARIEGVDVALRAADGRLILVIEDSAASTASAAMAQVALHPLVLNASLVYEHSGESTGTDMPGGYAAWRMTTEELARGAAVVAPTAAIPAQHAA